MPSSEAVIEMPSEPARKRQRLLDDAVKAAGSGTSVSLKIAQSFASDNQNLVILQVPESLLSEIGQDANQDLVKLIGGHDQDAVLVTGSQTFKLTKAETSNTLLLLPPPSEGNSDSLDKQSGSGGVPGSGEIDCQPKVAATQEFEGFEAVAAIGYQYELSKTTPPLEQIRELLEACLYQGADLEASVDRDALEKCMLKELQNRVQFSRRELCESLTELEAVLIEGRYRIMEPRLMDNTANAVLGVIVEQDMDLDKIDRTACVAALPECEPLVVEHCLRTYSIEETGDGKSEGKEEAKCTEAYYRLDLNKVARLRAHQILRARQAEEHDRPLSLADFVEQWAASMPGVDTPEVSLLKGIALVERSGCDKTATVSYVPLASLPFEPAERLAALFSIKPKWPMEDLDPYISDDCKKSGFLIKHARFSKDPVTGQKVCGAR